MTTSSQRLSTLRTQIESEIARHLPPGPSPDRGPDHESLAPDLSAAMRYSALAGGKRLRPLLCCAAAEAAGGRAQDALTAGCAIELLHTYSLIHDDLPAMDDDALRRGKPTCHVEFDEAQAILAGDALQALAFELLARMPVAPATALQMVSRLSTAAGWQGMVGGQSLDLALTGNQHVDQKTIESLHAAKTGALLRTSLELGVLCVQEPTPSDRVATDALNICSDIGALLGLAFQVIDDVLDVSQSTAVLGKDSGSDARQGKTTFVDLLGEDGARSYAHRLLQQALDAMPALPADTGLLEEVAKAVVFREN